VIRTTRLSKSFSYGGSQQHVLRNIDLEVAEGEFTVLMGPSGAGKSTLLYALSGMERPALGTVEFDGTRIDALRESQLAKFRRRNCGFVFQQSHLLDSMSALDNVLTAGLLPPTNRAAQVARANELFDLVGLDETTRRKMPRMLSGGEAQRVAIVRALINSPKVLFADEPTGQLNSKAGTEVLDLFGAVHRRGQTLIVVTHDVNTAARGSRLLYLRDGSIRDELVLPVYDPAASAAQHDARRARVAEFLAGQGW
jgi:putative ABC transport system ATP-binding protein